MKETGEHRKSGRMEIADTKTERTDRQNGEKANQKAERAKKKLERSFLNKGPQGLSTAK